MLHLGQIAGDLCGATSLSSFAVVRCNVVAWQSSTLEQIRALEESLGRSGYEFDRSAGVTAQDACQTLRGYGVRRENVRMNTGSDRFAFNTVQRNFLPEE